VPLGLAVALPEPRRVGSGERFRWAALGVLGRPRALVLLAFGTLYAAVAYAVEINLSPYYHAMGFDEAAVGALGATRYIRRGAGAVGLGLLGPRLGRPLTLALGILALAAGTGGQSVVQGWPTASALALAFGLANGWNDALFYVLAMEASDPR